MLFCLSCSQRPVGPDDFEMTDELLKTTQGQKMFYDLTGINNIYEILMYATKDNIKKLVKSDEW